MFKAVLFPQYLISMHVTDRTTRASFYIISDFWTVLWLGVGMGNKLLSSQPDPVAACQNSLEVIASEDHPLQLIIPLSIMQSYKSQFVFLSGFPKQIPHLPLLRSLSSCTSPLPPPTLWLSIVYITRHYPFSVALSTPTQLHK